MCDYSDVYFLVKERIIFKRTNAHNIRDKQLTFKNNAPFRSCISVIINTFIYNAKNLDIAMLMCNLLEYNDNYSMTSRSLWYYYRDEVNDDENENNDASNYRINNNKTTTNISFEYKSFICYGQEIT